MNLAPSALLFFTVLASNSGNPSYVTVNAAHRSLLRSSPSHEAALVDKKNSALSLRRKLGEMMPPEGCSVRCLQEPDRVHRSMGGALHPYPTGVIASSWNPNWREDLFDIDCSGINIGAPMRMNFDAPPPMAQTISNSLGPRVVAHADQDICEVVQNLPRRTHENNPRKQCEAAQWAHAFFQSKYPMLMEKMLSKMQLNTNKLSQDPAHIATCVALESQCLLTCVSSMSYDLHCFSACEASEAVCSSSVTPPIEDKNLPPAQDFQVPGESKEIVILPSSCGNSQIDKALDCMAIFAQNGSCDWNHWTEMYINCGFSEAGIDEFLLPIVKDGYCTQAGWTNDVFGPLTETYCQMPVQESIIVPPSSYIHIPNAYCSSYEHGGDGPCEVGRSFADVWQQCEGDGDTCMGVMWNSCGDHETSDTTVNGAWKLMSAGQDMNKCEDGYGHWDTFARKDMMP